MKTPEAPVPVVPDETEMEFESVEAQLSEKFSTDFVKILKRLAYEVAVVGLSEKEACLLVNFDYVKLVSLKEENEIVKRLFEMKSLEYKRGLMKTLSERARRGDEKLAQWLLESKFPEEFNRRKGVGGGGGEGGEDLLGAAVEFIQKSTAPDGLVKESSGRAFFVKRTGTEKEVPMNIHDTLTGRAKELVAQLDREEGHISA